jgi:hypothetical protein
LLQDLGFLAFTLPQVEILMPTKKLRGEELTRAQQRANQALHHRRLRIEQAVYPKPADNSDRSKTR